MNQRMADAFSDYVITYGIPIGTAIASLGVALNERLKRLRAEAREQVKERELEDIKRRSGGPFFQKLALMTGAGPNTLTGEYKGPRLAQGQQFKLVLSNEEGRGVRGVSFEMPHDWALFHGATDGIVGVGRTEVILSYPYDPQKHGTLQTVRVNFETYDGIKTHHVYSVRHGFCEFQRIDPI